MANAIRLVSWKEARAGTFAAMHLVEAVPHAGALIKEVGLDCALVPGFRNYECIGVCNS